MQCKCGDVAFTKELERKKLKAELRFYECRSCQRISNAVLTILGTEVATDLGGSTHARIAFESLTAESAAELLAPFNSVQNEAGQLGLGL